MLCIDVEGLPLKFSVKVLSYEYRGWLASVLKKHFAAAYAHGYNKAKAEIREKQLAFKESVEKEVTA